MKDTIVAISTSLGKGAIAIIKISGEEAIEIVNGVFKGKNLEKVKSHTINYGYIVDGEETIDEVLVSVMRGPKTFTTEDVVEINCHGGIITSKRIFELLLRKGCRLAEAGEFTKRAFLNGRINLLEAEAISDIIEAQNDVARSIAIKQIDGSSSKLIRELRDELLGLIANIEVNIDYPEYEDIEEITIKMLKESCQKIRASLEQIVSESENSKIYKNGIKTTIIGRPNVGKSSILNRLLNEDKAIVTDIEGTTRDVVEGSITVDGVNLDLIDTAGIRETSDKIEEIGVKKSLEVAKNADLILLVLNGNEKLKEDDYLLMKEFKDKSIITIINKSDLEEKIEISKIETPNIIKINTVDSKEIIELKNKIKEVFNLGRLSQNNYQILSNARQIALAKEALAILLDVEKALETEEYVDMIEIDIKRIWSKLGEILGESYEEELLDRLFSEFCLGK